MMSKIFLDTNILIYALDQADPGKKIKARSLLRSIVDEGRTGVISTQVLQEFYVASTCKLNLDPLQVKAIMRTFDELEIVSVTPGLIQDAIDCGIINRLSFWNALIIIAAESACCEKVWTENLNHGQVIRGVRVENPFRQGRMR
jgi:predicted nucleic acid-binding protein